MSTGYWAKKFAGCSAGIADSKRCRLNRVKNSHSHQITPIGKFIQHYTAYLVRQMRQFRVRELPIFWVWQPALNGSEKMTHALGALGKALIFPLCLQTFESRSNSR
jgi:hypothetical protein